MNLFGLSIFWANLAYPKDHADMSILPFVILMAIIGSSRGSGRQIIMSISECTIPYYLKYSTLIYSEFLLLP